MIVSTVTSAAAAADMNSMNAKDEEQSLLSFEHVLQEILQLDKDNSNHDHSAPRLAAVTAAIMEVASSSSSSVPSSPSELNRQPPVPIPVLSAGAVYVQAMTALEGTTDHTNTTNTSSSSYLLLWKDRIETQMALLALVKVTLPFLSVSDTQVGKHTSSKSSILVATFSQSSRIWRGLVETTLASYLLFLNHPPPPPSPVNEEEEEEEDHHQESQRPMHMQMQMLLVLLLARIGHVATHVLVRLRQERSCRDRPDQDLRRRTGLVAAVHECIRGIHIRLFELPLHHRLLLLPSSNIDDHHHQHHHQTTSTTTHTPVESLRSVLLQSNHHPACQAAQAALTELLLLCASSSSSLVSWGGSRRSRSRDCVCRWVHTTIVQYIQSQLGLATKQHIQQQQQQQPLQPQTQNRQGACAEGGTGGRGRGESWKVWLLFLETAEDSVLEALLSLDDDPEIEDPVVMNKKKKNGSGNVPALGRALMELWVAMMSQPPRIRSSSRRSSRSRSSCSDSGWRRCVLSCVVRILQQCGYHHTNDDIEDNDPDTRNNDNGDGKRNPRRRRNHNKTMTASTTTIATHATTRRRTMDVDAFALQVLGSVLQVNPRSTVFLLLACGEEEETPQVHEEERTVLGQAMVAAADRVLQSSSPFTNLNVITKLLPVVVQRLVQLIQPQPNRFNMNMNMNTDTGVVSETVMWELTQLFRSRLPNLLIIMRNDHHAATTNVDANSNTNSIRTCLERMVQHLSVIFHVEFRPTWSASLHAFVVLLEQVHAHIAHTIVVDAVQSLLELHNQLNNDVTEGQKQQVQNAVAALVQGVGMPVCWNWIEWKHVSSSSSKLSSLCGIRSDRVWTLRVMKTASRVAQPPGQFSLLLFFQNQVLPLAKECDQWATASTASSTKTTQDTHPLLHEHHTACVIHLWELFPPCCMSPGDWSSALQPLLTTTLSRALVDARYPPLKSIICSGLRKLSQSFDTYTMGPDRLAMQQMTVKILPVLFKLVCDSNPSSSPASSSLTSAKTLTPLSSDADVPIRDFADGSQSSARPQPRSDPAVSRSSPPTENVLLLPTLIDTVASLAPHAPDSFLRSTVRKLMRRIVDAMQSTSSSSSSISREKCVNHRDDYHSLGSLLSLAQGLVSARVLEEKEDEEEKKEVDLLYRTIKPLVRSDVYGASVQKRAYKVLASLCEHYPSKFTPMEALKELTTLLSSTMATTQVSARYMRLKCMLMLVEGLTEKDSEQLNALIQASAELLLCLKDSNAKARDTAQQLIRALSARVGVVPYVKAVAAALAAETPHMRSAAIMALTHIVRIEHAKTKTTERRRRNSMRLPPEELDTPEVLNLDDNEWHAHYHLPNLVRTVLVLVHDDAREVVGSVIDFLRVCVVAIPYALSLQSSSSSSLLGDIVVGLLQYTHAPKSNRFRGKIKIVLKKLLKRYGYETIEPLVPASARNLLKYLNKAERRELKQQQTKKQKNNNKRQRLNHEEDGLDNVGGDDTRTRSSSKFVSVGDSMVASSAEDDDDEESITPSMGVSTAAFSQLSVVGRQKQRPQQRVGRGSSVDSQSRRTTRTSRRAATAATIRLPNDQDDNHEVVNLLNYRSAPTFTAAAAGVVKTRRGFRADKEYNDMYFSDSDDLDEDDNDDNDSVSIQFDDQGRLIVRDEDDDEKALVHKDRTARAAEMRSTPRGGGGGGGGPFKKSKSNNPNPNPNHHVLGAAATRSNKAGGDVRRKEHVFEPYAYVPLDGRAYAKKHRRGTVEQMATLVSSSSGTAHQKKKNQKKNQHTKGAAARTTMKKRKRG